MKSVSPDLHRQVLDNLAQWLDVLGCPDCVASRSSSRVGELAMASEGVSCLECGRVYAMRNGLIELVGSGTKPLTWDRQVAFFDRPDDAAFELTRPASGGRFYEFLIRRRVSEALRALGEAHLDRAVEACCGSGMISQLLAESMPGVRIVGFDASAEAVRRACIRAQRNGYSFLGVVADAHYPPIRFGSGVTAFVHDALHHLDDPMETLRRLARSSPAVVVMEPEECLLTRLSVRLGISTDIEEAGNTVRRMVRNQVRRAARSAGARIAKWRRYLMYYPHKPGAGFRRLDNGLPFSFARLGHLAINATIGRVIGNKCHFVIRQSPEHSAGS